MPRWTAACLALIVTFLWSTSYILNKWAFAEGIGPLTLAGLRYLIAAITLCLLRAGRRTQGAPPDRPAVSPLGWVGLGLAGYVVAQGCQYLGQYTLTPTQASLILSVGNTLLAVAAGFLWLGEAPGPRQWAGIAIALGGVGLYYYPWNLGLESLAGIGMLLLSGTGYAVQLTANRALLARGAARPLELVLYPMAVGAVLLLAVGLWLEPWPGLSLRLAGLLLWLGPVNGALAFYLWTLSQQALQAFESSVLNNSMLLQIALLDVLLLDRSLAPAQLAALVLAGAGILTVQTAGRRKKEGHRPVA